MSPQGDDDGASEDGMGPVIAQIEQELSRLQVENAELRRVAAQAAEAAGRGDAATAASTLAAVAQLETCTDGNRGRGSNSSAGAAPSVPPMPGGSGAEGGLRAVLTSRTATSEQLRQAIGAVEALLSEAKRELKAKELRERRAAFEALHAATDAGGEAALEGAIAAAKHTGVDQEDIGRAEDKLKELRSLTDEERASKAAREEEVKRKKEAFLFVKQNDGPALTALLDSLPERVRWQDWRDHAGRTLWRWSQDLSAPRAQAALAPRLGLKGPKSDQNSSGTDSAKGASKGAKAKARPESPAAAEQPVDGRQRRPQARQATEGASETGASPSAGSDVAAAAAEEAFEPPMAWSASRDREGSSPPESPAHSRGYSVSPQKTPAEMGEDDKLKAKALRAVCQDDGVALAEVLETTPIEVVSGWQNRAGVDLLSLSEERGSAHAYSVLAKALGMVREMKRDEYEERETVWVFVQGDVMPRRATVLEDTPEEAETVLLEFWDGDDPPERVERSRVRRMWS